MIEKSSEQEELKNEIAAEIDWIKKDLEAEK